MLEKALVLVENIADIINTKKQEKETKEKIATIKVLGLKEDLDVPGNVVLTIYNIQVEFSYGREISRSFSNGDSKIK